MFFVNTFSVTCESDRGLESEEHDISGVGFGVPFGMRFYHGVDFCGLHVLIGPFELEVVLQARTEPGGPVFLRRSKKINSSRGKAHFYLRKKFKFTSM